MRPYPLHFGTSRKGAFRLIDALGALPPEADRKQRQQLCLQLAGRQLAPQDPQQHPGVFTNEYMLTTSYAEWSMQGREVWRIPPELTTAFLHSGISELQIGDLLPEDHGTGYIAFEGSDLVLPGLPSPVEGAYWHYNSFAELGLVFIGRSNSADPMHKALEGYRIPFLLTTFRLPADRAIDQAITDDIADLEAARKVATDPGMGETIDAAINRHKEARPALTKAMALVLNALAFRRGYADDVEIGWPAGAPQRMVDAVANASGSTARTRAVDKLWQLGWSPVHTLGPAVARELGRQIASHGRKAHMRAGHWRNQAHGPAMSLRKLIWIWPTFVSASGAEESPAESA